MDIQMITRQAFVVIGKEGQGLAAESQQWIPPLWQETNTHFGEIAALAKYDKATNAPFIWGAMSDIGKTFMPWGEQGMYLAGCEAKEVAAAPEGWTIWTIPSFTYVVIKCSQSAYGETFRYVLKEYFPQNGYALAGAVHEHYPQPGNTDLVALYFPIKKL